MSKEYEYIVTTIEKSNQMPEAYPSSCYFKIKSYLPAIIAEGPGFSEEKSTLNGKQVVKCNLIQEEIELLDSTCQNDSCDHHLSKQNS